MTRVGGEIAPNHRLRTTLDSSSFIKTYLSKYCVFIVKFPCLCESEEELTTIVVRSSISHCNQTSPDKTQSGMELILKY